MERGWLDSPMFSSEPYTDRDAWSWLIGEARWDDGNLCIKGKPFPIKRGQVYSSVRFMAEKFQWSTNRVLRFLEKLKNWKMIDVQTETCQNLITICNYSKYQDRRDTNGDSNRDTSGDSTGDTNGDKQEETQEIQRNSKNVLEHASKIEAETIPKIKPEKGKRLEPFLQSTFLSQDIPQEWGDWAHGELHLSVEDINWEWNKFRDWWAAASGQKGVKSDWFATWRNWMRKKYEDKARKEKLNELYTQKRSKF